MLKKYITHAAVSGPYQELSPERRKQLRAGLSPAAARRMSDLPLLLAEVTTGAEPTPADEWIYASSYGAPQSLNKFLASFPNPSPLHFQNSIHPGALDLVNVNRQQPSGIHLPLGGGDTLLADALLMALLSPVPAVHLVGGDEYEPWAKNYDCGGTCSFAYYLKITASNTHAIGELSFSSDVEDASSTPTFAEILARLESRESLAIALSERGTYHLTWL